MGPDHWTGLDMTIYMSLGPTRMDTLLDYEPNVGSPATPVDDSILDQSTDDGGKAAEVDEEEKQAPRTDDDMGQTETDGGVYFEPSMVEAVITEQDEGAEDRMETDDSNTNEGGGRGEAAKKNKGSG